MVLKVSPEYLRPLELNVWHEVEGCTVMFVDANHCPGACMIIFKMQNTGEVQLHCGDFRADSEFVMAFKAQLMSLGISKISTIYLDTTYADPEHVFPRQQEVIGKTCTIVADIVSGASDKQKRLVPLRWLVVTCSYMIGKERLAIHLSRILGCKVYVSAFKQRLLQCIQDEGFEMDAFTSDSKDTFLHMASMEVTSKKEAEEYFKGYSKKFSHMLVVNPSGWNHDKQQQSFKWLVKEKIGMISVPYSEHSSWNELIEFVKAVPCDYLIPTVGNYWQILKVSKEHPEEALHEWHKRCNEKKEKF